MVKTNLPIRWFYTGMIFYFPDLSAMFFSGDVNVPEDHSLYRLGCWARSHGDVWRIHDVDLWVDDLSVSTTAESRLVQPEIV